MSLAFDAARKRQRGFGYSRWAEENYARNLRRIARHVGDLIKSFPGVNVSTLQPMRAALRAYSEALTPWAEAAAGRMIGEIQRRDERAWGQHADTWYSHSAAIGKALKQEIAEAPTGAVYRGLMALNVGLITSLPIDAGERVHTLVTEGLTSGRRPSDIAEEIHRSGEVSASRANLIARTEAARAASTLTQARAEHIGSTAYVWRTSRDEAVRPSHRGMEGKTVRWDTPPTLDGMVGHAGCFPRCRCFGEPQLP